MQFAGVNGETPSFHVSSQNTWAKCQFAAWLVDKFAKVIVPESAIPPSLKRFEAVLARMKDTAPGPDGLISSCWQASLARSARVLHDVFYTMAAGCRPGLCFNENTIAFKTFVGCHKNAA